MKTKILVIVILVVVEARRLDFEFRNFSKAYDERETTRPAPQPNNTRLISPLPPNRAEGEIQRMRVLPDNIVL